MVNFSKNHWYVRRCTARRRQWQASEKAGDNFSHVPRGGRLSIVSMRSCCRQAATIDFDDTDRQNSDNYEQNYVRRNCNRMRMNSADNKSSSSGDKMFVEALITSTCISPVLASSSGLAPELFCRKHLWNVYFLIIWFAGSAYNTIYLRQHVFAVWFLHRTLSHRFSGCPSCEYSRTDIPVDIN